MTENQILFSLLRTQLNGVPVDEDSRKSLTPENLAFICELADAHDMGHLIGQALSGYNDLPQSNTVVLMKQRAMQAVMRYMSQTRDLMGIGKTLEDAEISHIPLKGSVLRDFYPEPWFRTSGDIDVLVKQEDLEKTSQILQEKLDYKYQALSNHDIALRTPAGTLLELHYDITEDLLSPEQERIMSGVWEKTVTPDGKQYGKKMSDEMFYFYHIAHMAKHFMYGGCGIRPLMDIWIMNHRMNFDRDRCFALLRQGGLEAFAHRAERLSEIWFSGEAYEPLYEQMEQYILSGGVYGTVENRVTMSRVRSGSSLKYLLSRVFLTYEDLQYYYPILRKQKWLYPFCQIARWLSLLFGKGKAHAAEVFRSNVHLEGEELDSTAQFLKKMGL